MNLSGAHFLVEVHMFNWFKSPEQTPPKIEPRVNRSFFSTHALEEGFPRIDRDQLFSELKRSQPVFTGEFALDDSSNGLANFKTFDNGQNSVSDNLIAWYATQGFIGHQLCAILAQHWLINKCCSMPASDAVRKGYNIVSVDGDDLDEESSKILKRFDRSFKINKHMREFVRKGRIFGVRIAMFKVESTDPEYYLKPFNIDGVTLGSYKGIVQIDPYWVAPMLDQASASQPDSLNFYEPTFWMINGQQIHRSHLIIYRHEQPANILQPQYLYGGVPLPQLLMERVYASERTANEAPQLAMTKRVSVWLTDMEKAMSNSSDTFSRLNLWSQMRDNYGIKLGDKDGDEFSQFDTSLTDLDSVIMTQYQLVAAIAGVPSTKLLGTSPKGFGASGEYEESSYHEMLESIQEDALTPFLERHHALVMKSYVEPATGITDIKTTVNWQPLDTPTAKELADTNYVKAQTGALLIESGALSAEDERERIATDKQSGYHELGLEEMPDQTLDDEPDDAETQDD
jgi:phage-related protein (TIGR01555 family)